VKVCKKCGGTDFVPSGYCRPCAKVRVAKWQKEHPERGIAASKKWREAHREKSRANTKKWQEKNKEYRAEYGRKWREEHQEEHKAAKKKWREKNKDRHEQYQIAWETANRKRRSAGRKEWREQNRERDRKNLIEWAKKYPDRVRIKAQNRRAKKKSNGGSLSRDIVSKLLQLQKEKCAICRVPLNGEYHLDHILPLILKGRNEDKNMQLLCPPCNLSKSSKHPIEFMQSRGFLC